MGRMNDLHIMLREAESHASFALNHPSGLSGKRTHDVITELVSTIRAMATTKGADDQSEPQLVALVKEIHEAVVNRAPERLVFEIETPNSATLEAMSAALRPDDILIDKSAGITLLNGTVGTDITRPVDTEDHPETPYGARIFYADGTMEEISNVDGIQVAKLDDGTFPFAFLAVDDEEDKPDGHRAGYFDEEGMFTPFSDREQPRPGW